jgi:uncharacterized membrane protein YdjX (TVP38/TMEM64 family)
MKNTRASLALALLAAVILTAVFLPVEELLSGAQQWTDANQSTALYFATGGLVIGILLMLPASLMLMLAGFLFGLARGFAIVWIAGLVASTLAFLLGRSIARPWMERRIQRKTTFIAIDRAIKRKGFLVVLLTRLVMVLPYPALNYSLGLTNVSMKDYVLGTNIGMAPPMFLFVYLGTTVSNITAIMHGDISLQRAEWVTGTLALVTVVAVIAVLIRKAAAVLKEELTEASTERQES